MTLLTCSSNDFASSVNPKLLKNETTSDTSHEEASGANFCLLLEFVSVGIPSEKDPVFAESPFLESGVRGGTKKQRVRKYINNS